MKRFSIVLTAIVAMMAFGVVAAIAGNAIDASFTTAVTYQNLGDTTANIQFSFYNESQQVATENKTINANAGASLYVGNVSDVGAGFQGAGVVVADQPIAATMVQISDDPDVRNRPLSNGFTEGASEILLATVLKNQFGITSRFSIQNANMTDNVDLTVNFYEVGSTTPIVKTYENLEPGSAKYFDMETLSGFGTANDSFNGSAIVSAVVSGSTTPAPIVGTVMELGVANDRAASFEAVTGGAKTVYMPSASCNFFGTSSYYAIQNTSRDGSTNVTINYASGSSKTVSIPAGSKFSAVSCDNVAEGVSTSATITSDSEDIVVIGKVIGAGIYAIFLGESDGSSTLAMPYVRWTNDNWRAGGNQRAYLAIQNVGSALNAGDVTVKYLSKEGNLVATHALGAMANGQKLNSWAIHENVTVVDSSYDMSEFGYNDGFGGAVLIEGPAGSELVSLARIQANNGGSNQVGEDYNGISVD